MYMQFIRDPIKNIAYYHSKDIKAPGEIRIEIEIITDIDIPPGLFCVVVVLADISFVMSNDFLQAGRTWSLLSSAFCRRVGVFPSC